MPLKTILYQGLYGVALVCGLCSPLFAAITVIQVYFVDPNYIARGVPFFRYQMWATLVFFASLLLHQPKGLPAVGRESRLLWALWLYAANAILTSLWAVHDSAYAYEHAIEFSKSIAVAALIPLVIRSRRDLDILIFACIVAILHSAFMQTSGIHHLNWISERFSAYILTDRTGSVFMLFIPVILLLAIYGKRWERVVCWLSIPFVIDAIVRTDHRAYFVALCGQVLLLVFFLPKRILARMFLPMAAGACLFVFVLTPPQYWKWMSTLKSPTQESSAASRFDINRASLRMLRDHPFGVGYRNYGDVVSPRYLHYRKRSHNTFFSVACETGIQGFAIWAFAIGGTVLVFRRIRKQEDPSAPTRIGLYAMGFELGIYGCLIGDCFHSGYETDPLYWLVGFAVILTRVKAHGMDSVRTTEEQRVQRQPAPDEYQAVLSPSGSS